MQNIGAPEFPDRIAVTVLKIGSQELQVYWRKNTAELETGINFNGQDIKTGTLLGLSAELPKTMSIINTPTAITTIEVK